MNRSLARLLLLPSALLWMSCAGPGGKGAGAIEVIRLVDHFAEAEIAGSPGSLDAPEPERIEWRAVNAVTIARFEYRRWPPRRPFFGGLHAPIAASLSQIVTSPRFLRPRSYSLQFRILYIVLYLLLTRLDFRVAMASPPRP